MRTQIFGRDLKSFDEVGYGFGRAAIVYEKSSKINVGAGIVGAFTHLPGDSSPVGSHCVFYPAEPFVRQSKIVFRFDVLRVEFQALREDADGLFEAILV